VRVAARVTRALPTARVASLDLAAGELLLERRYLREDQPIEPIPLLLPTGVRRMVLSGAGVQGEGLVQSAEVIPLAVVRRDARGVLAWPRRPNEDLYRVLNAGVRATALDLASRSGDGFRVEGSARFVVEASDGERVRIEVAREAPLLGDLLEWGERRVPLGRLGLVSLELPADQGESLDGLRLIPVRLASQGSRITFSGSRSSLPLR
jgi:hypothetical protein